jgi:hypothetical protein
MDIRHPVFMGDLARHFDGKTKVIRHRLCPLPVSGNRCATVLEIDHAAVAITGNAVWPLNRKERPVNRKRKAGICRPFP